MAKKSASRKKTTATVRKRPRATGRTRRRKPGSTQETLIVRAVDAAPRGRASDAGAAEPDLPEARIARNGGRVSVEITFGHAQHGTYTIQLFDPGATTELAREAGFSTDDVPDRFDLTPSAAQLDRHFVQWSGAVDAFSPAPGQRFSVIFEVLQGGETVPGGRVEKSGPLDITQAFLGILRLVAS